MANSKDSQGADRTFMRTSAGTDTSAPPLAAGVRLGPWAIEAAIASGGMGQVYRAMRADGVYNQAVAVKLIHDNDPVRVDRFGTERQRLAEMDHPGIARIIDGGTHDDGRPWMAMELVEGAPIMPQAFALPRNHRLRLFIGLVSAVSHAHGRLVLHRDLKAQNVLLDAAGAVRLIDFGIASLAEGETAPSSSFTAATAAPEQLRGEPPTVQTDIFALGCILHELLTGAVPERTEAGGVRLNAGAVADPDLVAIITRATAPLPGDRYPTADALADDVAAVLESRPVTARQGGALYRAGKFARRSPVATALGAAFIAALVGGTGVSLAYARQASAEAARAQSELERAEFFLDRAEALNDAQEAFGDLLRRITAGDTDVERESLLLMERWQEAHDNRKIAPGTAAAISYAVGKHFALRGDNQRAIAVLEPWISEGYGPKGLIDLSRVFLASSYHYTGQSDRATAMLQQLDREMSGTFDANTINHAQVVSDLAMAANTPETAQRSITVMEAALKNEKSPDVRSVLWNQLGGARLGIGDRIGATQAYREAVKVQAANPLADQANLGTLRVNLAAAELYFANRPDAALEQADIALGPVRAAMGENVMTGFAFMVRGEAKLAQGDTAGALADTRSGLEMVGRYNGTETASWVNAACAYAAAMLASGDLAGAEALVSRMEAVARDHDLSTTMGELARARLLATRGDMAGARKQLALARANTAGLERGMANAWRVAQAEAWVAAKAKR
jgi:hypothetical protein